MATTRRIWFNPIKRTFKIQLDDKTLIVEPNAVTTTTGVVAVGEVARQLYNALLCHNRSILDNLISSLLPVIQLLST